MQSHSPSGSCLIPAPLVWWNCKTTTLHTWFSVSDECRKGIHSSVTHVNWKPVFPSRICFHTGTLRHGPSCAVQAFLPIILSGRCHILNTLWEHYNSRLNKTPTVLQWVISHGNNRKTGKVKMWETLEGKSQEYGIT